MTCTLSRRCLPAPLVLALLLAAWTLASCQALAKTPALAPHMGHWIRTDLYFGLTRRDSSPIADAAFQNFVDATITPAFPDGFTITPAAGQYLDSQQQLHKEPSRVLTLLYSQKAAAACNQKIEAISAAYCRQFGQESVLRTDTRALTEFITDGH